MRVQELEKMKEAIARLEGQSKSDREELEAARAEFANVKAFRSVPAAGPASPSRTQSVELETLRQQIVELQAEKEDLNAALKTTQEDAMAQVEAYQKISEHELRVREEDHANTIALLKREMSSGSGSVPSTPGKPVAHGATTPGGSPLAHQVQPQDVEGVEDA